MGDHHTELLLLPLQRAPLGDVTIDLEDLQWATTRVAHHDLATLDDDLRSIAMDLNQLALPARQRLEGDLNSRRGLGESGLQQRVEHLAGGVNSGPAVQILSAWIPVQNG